MTEVRMKLSHSLKILSENADKIGILKNFCAVYPEQERMSLNACKANIFGDCVSPSRHGMVVA